MLEIKNLTKAYQDNQVLKGINLTLQPGSIYALVGPNGSGKTTLLNCISNISPADDGVVSISGIDNHHLRFYHYLSYSLDNTILYPYLSGYDHLMYAAKIYGLSKEQVKETAEKFEISRFYRQKVSSYSLGMKQKLLIALALLNDPPYIILDEPLNGLDPTSILFMRHKLIEWADQGKMVLMASHLLNEIEMVTSRILFLKDGQIIERQLEENQRGSLEEMYRNLYL